MGEVSLNRGRLLRSVAPVVLLAAGLPLGGAYAQEATPQQTSTTPDRIEVVTVTAEKRLENVQNVPIAITAFTGSQLQDKAITDIHALSNLTPGVNFDAGSPFSGSTSVLSASIRGIGQDDFAFNVDPGVGLYVDGVYFARTIGANQNLMDVERVEISKGPQGTLFGRNTIGGAISVVTRDPGSEFMLRAEATTGSFSRRDVAVTADIPITDTLRSSITFSSLIRDGYQKRIPFPGAIGPVEPIGYFHPGFNVEGIVNGDTQGGQNQQVVRGKLVWDARPDLHFTLEGDWTHEDQSATAQTDLETEENNPASLLSIYNGCIVGAIPAFFPVCGPTGPATAVTPAGIVTTGIPLAGIGRTPFTNAVVNTGDIDTTFATGPSFSKLDSWGVALIADWTLNPNISLKSITAFRGVQWSFGLDFDGSPIRVSELSAPETQHQISQEVQLLGNAFDNRLNYVVGFYYFNEYGFIHDLVDLTVLNIDGLNTFDTKSYAGFVHANYNVTNRLGIVVGARYSVEQKAFEGGQRDLNAFTYKAAQSFSGAPPGTFYPITPVGQAILGFPVPGDPLRFFPAGVNHQTFYLFTPTAGIDYHFTDDLMAYFTWSKGFKSGGWTTRLSAPIPDAKFAQFGPEKAKTYEVGIKSEWLDHRLLLNWDGYYTFYDGIQLDVQVGFSPTFKNAGDAEIRGMELEGKYLVGHGLSINGNVSYIEAQYTNTAIGTLTPTTALPLGTKLPKTPKWKFDLSPEYDYTLPNDATVTYLFDWIHTSSIFNDVFNTPQLRRPTSDIFNMSLHYLSPNGKYEITAGGTNITNERFLTTGVAQIAGGQIQGTFNAPAQWYLSLSLKY